MVSLLRKLISFLIHKYSEKNNINEQVRLIKILEKHHLFKSKKIIILNEVIRLILEILSGSLKINSSIMGNITVIFKILDGVNLNSFREGYKLKYLNGVTMSIPVTRSITRIIRKTFHINFKKEEMELISNCFPGLGFFRKIVKSLKSIIIQLKNNKLRVSKANIEKCN